jgi:hypothetical protein
LTLADDICQTVEAPLTWRTAKGNHMDEYEAAPLLLQALEDMIEMATHHAMPEAQRRQILRRAREIVAEVKGLG